MSEYQCYEFVALDRPLSAKEMAALRDISTRAEISSTRFWNEYQWGDLKADPAKLLQRYFDAHLYHSNWGTHRLMLRVPAARVDRKALPLYFSNGAATRLIRAGEYLVLDLLSESEDAEDDDELASVGTLSQVRAELMGGDMRPAYLAWLLAVQAGDVDDTDVEPPLPNGLGSLTAAQQSMVDFLRIDDDLVAVAARASVTPPDDGEPLRRWLVGLSSKEKDAWLLRAVAEPRLALGDDLRRAFRARQEPRTKQQRRTVGDLRAAAEARCEARQKAATTRQHKKRATVEAARQRHLARLARDVDAVWRKLEGLVESRSYDEAVQLAVDLRDLAVQGDSTPDFAARFKAFRKRQQKRSAFFGRWARASAPPSRW